MQKLLFLLWICTYLNRKRSNHPLRAIRQITDRILKEMSRVFARMYARLGRPSIPPEKLLRALLLQILYSLRSERMLMEQLGTGIAAHKRETSRRPWAHR